MDAIELWNGSTKALIDLEGAWLTNLSDDRGDILFPKRMLTAPDGTKKARGGCHVCLPNFGPGGDSGLPQHGFGRLAVWEMASKTENKVILMLSGGAKGYEALQSRLTYELSDTSIKITLDLINNGEAELRVAPAFHPYFALQADEAHVKVDGRRMDLDELGGTVFEEGDIKELATSRRHFRLESSSLPTWAIWTDHLAQYACVEPTLGGYTFLDGKPASAELIHPGKPRTFTFIASW